MPEKHTSKFFDTIYKYAVATLLIFIPLYPKFPLFTVPFSYVSIRAEDFLIGVVWLLYFARIVIHRRLKLPPITLQIFTYFTIGALSVLSAILITHNIRPLLAILHLLRRIEYVSVLFFVYELARNKATRRFLIEVMIYPSILVFVYGIMQMYFKAPVISTMDAESSKGYAQELRPGIMLSSTFAGHYDLAVYLCFIICLLVSQILTTAKRHVALLSYLLLCALFWLNMQAGLRTSLVGLALAILLISYLHKKYLLGAFLFFTFIASIFTSPSLLARFQKLINVVTAKISVVEIIPSVFASSEVYPVKKLSPTTIITPTVTPEPQRAIQADISTSIRFDVEWPRAIRSFLKNPFLGTGFSSLGLATDSDYLRALGETGMLGLIAFLTLLFAPLKIIYQQLKNKANHYISIPVLGIIVVFLTTAVFLDVFESSKIATLFWGFLGLALSLDHENS